jgi:hypothetical protein
MAGLWELGRIVEEGRHDTLAAADYPDYPDYPLAQIIIRVICAICSLSSLSADCAVSGG